MGRSRVDAGRFRGTDRVRFFAGIAVPFSPYPTTMETLEDLNAIDTEALKARLGQLRRYL